MPDSPVFLYERPAAIFDAIGATRRMHSMMEK